MEEISYDENSSAKKKKLKKEQGAMKEEEEEQSPLTKKKKKFKKERERSHEKEDLSHEKEEETSVKKKLRVIDSVEGNSPKKQTKRHRENSLERKLAVNKEEEEEEEREQRQEKKKKKKKKNLQKDPTVVNDRMEDPESEDGVHAEGHVKTVAVSFRLLVPSKDMGKVIGKQGSRIQQLREESGALIKIGDAIMNLEERVIWIASKEETFTSQSAAERALLLVATLLIRPENEDQDFAKIRLLVARSQVKIAVSKDGKTLDKLSADTGAVVNVFTKDRFPLLALASETDILLQIEGKSYEVQEALELVVTRLRESLQQSGTVGRSIGRTKGGAFKTTVKIRVPYELIGKLIGKDGSTLWQIREQCRVFIELLDDIEHGGQGKIVHLEGMLSQVTMAQTLLQVFLAPKDRAK